MSATPAGIPGFNRIAQVKLPVTDLARSVTWYCRLLDRRLWAEFVVDGARRGAGLIDPECRFSVALRDRSVCASQPDLNGFDILALVPASRAVLDDIAARCDRLGIAHSGIQDTPAGPRLDIPHRTAQSFASTSSPPPPTDSPVSKCATGTMSAPTTPHSYRDPFTTRDRGPRQGDHAQDHDAGERGTRSPTISRS